MRARLIMTVLGVAALAAAGGGAARAQDRGREDGRLSQQIDVTHPLAAGGRVSLKSITGSVRVAAWERAEVRVVAVKRAHTQKRLDEADVEIVATADGVSIRTRYPEGELNFERNGRDNPASVEYTLTVPRAARVDSIELVNGALEVEGLAGEIRAASVNGRLVARKLSGPARLSTVNGALDVTFEQVSSGTISLGSVNGLLTVTLPSDADATLRATTVHGTISTDLPLTVQRGQHFGASLAGTLGGGAARVKLDNVNGAIRIRRAADGRTPSAVRAPDGTQR